MKTRAFILAAMLLAFAGIVLGQQARRSIIIPPPAPENTQIVNIAQESGPIPFTYQGKLVFNNVPANGDYDFVIYICSSPDPAGQDKSKCEDSRTINSVNVASGIFTVHLDFDQSLFEKNESLYLDISVSQAGQNNFTELSPRQQIDQTPYAKRASTSNNLDCSACITDGHIASVNGGKISGKVASATNADNATNAVTAQTAVNATFAATAQNAVNAVDLTSNQTVAGNKSFSGILSGNGSGLLNVPGTLKWNVSSATSLQSQSNNGYVLTNTSSTTVTLPASPNVGDVIRIMEKGTGGFTLAMNQGQSILDWATTHQETIWTRQYSVIASSNTNSWSGVASSADGVKLAAVEYPGIIATSINSGQTWTPRMNDVARNWTAIASSSDGTKLVATIEGGYIYTSIDSGVTWTSRMTDANRNWYSVASSADGTKLVAADNHSVYTSTDSGVNWTARMTPNAISRVASSADGTRLIAAVNLGHVYTSNTSGVLWIDRLSSTFNQWQSVASSSDGSKLVAVESPGKIWVSSNLGVAWTSFTLGPSGINTSWNGASMSSDGTRIAVSAGGAVGGGGAVGLVAISYDGGNSWTPTGIGTVWSAVAVAGNGTQMSAAMIDNNLNKLYSGPVGTQTFVDTITGVKDSSVELVYIGSNQFAMVSSSGMTIPPHTY